jgi:tRNA threonylcarbamoyladenosine biosynthesis protein TsaB
MLKLIIDTAITPSFIAIAKNSEIIDSILIERNFLTSNKFIFELDALLKKNNILISQISYLCIGNGPGSYTGLRVGASIANALFFAKKIPIISFCSLMSYLPFKNGTFATLFDAKTGGVYTIFGKIFNGKILLENISKPEKLSIEKATVKLQDVDNIISAHKTSLIKRFDDKTSSIKWNEGLINFDSLLEIINEKIDRKDFEKSPIELNYL